MKIKAKPEEDIPSAFARQAQIDKLKKECQRLESRIHREKQFNRKLGPDMELQRKQEALKQLLGSDWGLEE